MDGRPSYLVFLGMPGAGKGTQVQRLADASGLPHVSTGDLFRRHLRERTDLGLLAQSYMNQGALVPDDVTIRMAQARLDAPDSARGALLDGFPRNLAQADALAEIAAARRGAVTAVCLELDDAVCRERITGRRQCRACNAIYHVRFNPPRGAGVCDQCAGALYQREDDTEAALSVRILAYYKETAPLIGYFHAQRALLAVSADGAPDAVAARLQEACAAQLALRRV